jgi:hypothetical protein
LKPRRTIARPGSGSVLGLAAPGLACWFAIAALAIAGLGGWRWGRGALIALALLLAASTVCGLAVFVGRRPLWQRVLILCWDAAPAACSLPFFLSVL